MAISVQNFNPMVAVKAGVDTSQAMFTAERKARQYNALRQLYGDAVGPDDTLSQLDANNRANQLQPGKLEEQSLSNQGLRQTNAFNELMNPLKVQSAQGQLDKQSLSNDFDRQTLGSRVQQEANTAAQGQLNTKVTQNKLDTAESEAADSQAERQRNAALGIASAAKARIEAGEDPTAVWNSIAPQIAAMENVDPGQLTQLRDMFVRDPKGTIGMVEQHANATRPNAAYMRAQAAQTAANAAQLRAQNAGQGKGAKADPETIANALDLSTARIQANIDNIDRLTGSGEQPGTLQRNMSRYGLGRTIQEGLAERGIAADSGSYGVHKDIDGIKHSISITDLENIKDLGLSLGRVTNVEFQAAANALESLDPREPPERTAEKLRVVRNFLAKAGELKQERARRMREKAGAPQPGAPAAAPADDQAARRRALLDKDR